jgi:hypothetical protein
VHAKIIMRLSIFCIGAAQLCVATASAQSWSADDADMHVRPVTQTGASEGSTYAPPAAVAISATEATPAANANATRQAGAAGPNAAQPAAAGDDSWGKERVLGGHRFAVAVFVPDALPSSYLGVRAGFEYHEVPGYAQLPSLVSSTAQAVDLQTVNVTETIDFAVRLHDYIAIYGDAYGHARIGANISTLLGTGADYTYGGDLGLLAKLFRAGGFQLAVRGQLGYYAGQSAGIIQLFNDLNAIASNAIQQVESNPTLDLNKAVNQLNASFGNATADLLTPFDGFAYGFSLNAAQALGRVVGLQASLGFASDTATYRPTAFDAKSGVPTMSVYSVKSIRPTLALALDFDLASAGLPIDLMLEYRGTPLQVTYSGDTNSPSESSIEHLVAIGVYYAGRRDLQLGVTGYTLFGQTPALGANAVPSGKPLDIAGQFVFRYLW